MLYMMAIKMHILNNATEVIQSCLLTSLFAILYTRSCGERMAAFFAQQESFFNVYKEIQHAGFLQDRQIDMSFLHRTPYYRLFMLIGGFFLKKMYQNKA